MIKKIIAVLVFTILMLLFFSFLPKPKIQETEEEVLVQSTPKIVETAKVTFKGSLKEAVALDQDLVCSWVGKDNVISTGFIKDKQYFAKIIRQGKTGYLIIKDDCYWTWDEEETKGVKNCVELTGNKETIWDLPETLPETIYSCNPTLVEENQFNLPSQIEFVAEEQEDIKR